MSTHKPTDPSQNHPADIPADQPVHEPSVPPDESLIQYPSAFPIKVMGAHHEEFIAAVVATAQQHDPAFDAATIEHRPSSSGNYLGLTITVTATSREQLDNIYRALTSLPHVKYVL